MKILAKGVLAGVLALGLTGAAAAADGFYTTQQAERGHTDYIANCSQCHGDKLQGNVGPSLIGTDFLGTWGTADDIYKYFSVAMPPQAPGKLGDAVYTDILSYILSVNNVPAGSKELPQDAATRKSINLAQSAGKPINTGGNATTTSNAPNQTVPTDNSQSAQASATNTMPQAFTYGKPLPTVQPDGSIKNVPAKPGGGSANP